VACRGGSDSCRGAEGRPSEAFVASAATAGGPARRSHACGPSRRCCLTGPAAGWVLDQAPKSEIARGVAPPCHAMERASAGSRPEYESEKWKRLIAERIPMSILEKAGMVHDALWHGTRRADARDNRVKRLPLYIGGSRRFARPLHPPGQSATCRTSSVILGSATSSAAVMPMVGG
jgi:hypothetical protein